VADGGIEIGIAGSVRAGAGIVLPDAAAAVDEGFVEAAMRGLVGLGVAQVPLAEDAG
jgi:hypothetical protein